MKVAPEAQTSAQTWIRPLEFELPNGLIGLEEATRFELLVNEEEKPFMWIRCVDQRELGFIVIEPSELLRDYQIEIADDDAAKLGIVAPEDVLVLNIVTLHGEDIDTATVNLVGPVVLNRETLRGRQLVVANYMKFSARHPLLTESALGAAR